MMAPRPMRTNRTIARRGIHCRDSAHGPSVSRVTPIRVRSIKPGERSTSDFVAGTEELEERACDAIARRVRLRLRRRRFLVERGDRVVELLGRAVEPFVEAREKLRHVGEPFRHTYSVSSQRLDRGR